MSTLIGADCCKNCKASFYDQNEDKRYCRFFPPTLVPVVFHVKVKNKQGKESIIGELDSTFSVWPKVLDHWRCEQHKRYSIHIDQNSPEQ